MTSMNKLNPDALGECGDVERDEREAVQPVTGPMIYEHVVNSGELPKESAKPFAKWLNAVWNSFNENGELTNGKIIAGALAHWRGQ